MNEIYTHNRSKIRDNKAKRYIVLYTIDYRIDWSNCEEIYKENS